MIFHTRIAIAVIVVTASLDHENRNIHTVLVIGCETPGFCGAEDADINITYGRAICSSRLKGSRI
jgi:hypothetical protein